MYRRCVPAFNYVTRMRLQGLIGNYIFYQKKYTGRLTGRCPAADGTADGWMLSSAMSFLESITNSATVICL